MNRARSFKIIALGVIICFDNNAFFLIYTPQANVFTFLSIYKVNCNKNNLNINLIIRLFGKKNEKQNSCCHILCHDIDQPNFKQQTTQNR